MDFWPFGKSGATDLEADALSIEEEKAARTIEEVIAALDDELVLTASGRKVTPLQALQITTVLACVRVIAEGCAQLPLKIFREKGRGKEVAKDLDVHRLLYRRPNDFQTAFEFREGLSMHAALGCGGLAWINRGPRNEPLELLPLLPGRVSWKQNADWTLTYTIRLEDGGELIAPQADIFHLRGPSWDGVSALEITKLAREAIGLAAVTEAGQAKYHGRGGRPAGQIVTPSPLKAEAAKSLAKAWKAAHGSDWYKTAIFDNGAEFKPLGYSAEDSQTIETRRLQIEEVCRAFKVFPQMIGHADKTATYASAESFFMAHVTHTLAPWLERWEQKIDATLLGNAPDLYAKHNANALLRGTAKDRGEFYNKGISAGWLTRNEVRELEDLDPLDGLDEPLTPLNMTTDPDKEVPTDATEK